MVNPVKTRVAKSRTKPRTRRVKKQLTEKMSDKIEVKFTPTEKARFQKVCTDRDQPMATVLHTLAMRYTAAIEREDDLAIPVEFRCRGEGKGGVHENTVAPARKRGK